MNDLTDKNFWNNRWDSEDGQGSHDRHFLITNKESVRLLKKVLLNVPKDGKILELGAAPGSVLAQYFKLRPDITCDGLDISDIGVAETNKRFARENIKGEMHLVSFRDAPDHLMGKYDLVCSHGLIEHFEDFDTVIADHLKFAKKGAVAFMTLPNYAVTPVKQCITAFSHETLEAHNLKCMNLDILKKSYPKDISEEISISSYGGAIFPSSAVNKGICGALYKRFAQAWNVIVSTVAFLTFGKVVLRIWDSNFYLLLKKK